jgi:SAM-dependent methyltransferase
MNRELNKEYWNNRYLQQQTGWDIGSVAPPLKEYIDQLINKNISILIPGCGNAYEAAYLLQQGFKNVTLVDIAPAATAAVEDKLSTYINNGLRIITGDFFDLKTTYDLILEQTFFCALDPTLRSTYVEKMVSLLNPDGKLVGLLFNRYFEGGPPFGGSKLEYQELFTPQFNIQMMDTAYNSIAPRAGTELFVKMTKNRS